MLVSGEWNGMKLLFCSCCQAARHSTLHSIKQQKPENQSWIPLGSRFLTTVTDQTWIQHTSTLQATSNFQNLLAKICFISCFKYHWLKNLSGQWSCSSGNMRIKHLYQLNSLKYHWSLWVILDLTCCFYFFLRISVIIWVFVSRRK